MAEARKPFRHIPPGKIISKELKARCWTEEALAAVMDCSIQELNEILQGSKQITPELAQDLAVIFGTTRELWMNLEINYRKYLDR